MLPIYTLRHYRDGDHIDTYDDMTELAYEVIRNAEGALSFEFSASHRIADTVEEGDRFEVWCERPGVEGLDQDGFVFGAFYLDDGVAFVEPGDERYQADCVGDMWLLAGRIVAYPSDQEGLGKLTSFEASEAMRALVQANITADATIANGREEEGPPVGYTITVLDDGPKSSVTRDWDVYHKPLLAALQDIAKVADLTFDLVRTGSASWEFRVYGPNERDVSADVVFSLENDNMASPRRFTRRSDAFNSAIVGGQGKGSAQQVLAVRAPTWTAASHRERYVPARTSQSELSLQAEGELALRDGRPVEGIEFQVLQTDDYRYRREYDVGYIVAASYGGLLQPQRIESVRVVWSLGGPETIEVRPAPL